MLSLAHENGVGRKTSRGSYSKQFIQDVNEIIFYTDVFALEGIEEDVS
jgi:hypothetical protein